MNKLLKNQRGLTLIELLAVIVILGIIAAIAVPAIGNIIENSRNKATVSEAVQIIDAAKIAKAENPDATNFKYDEDGTVKLKDYLDKINDENTGFTVTYDNDEKAYSISNHPAVSVVTEVKEDSASVTEKDLINYIDGND